MNKRVFKLAVSGLMLTLALPVMSQGTNEYLQPCDIILPKYEAVYVGNILEDPEGLTQKDQFPVSESIKMKLVL